MDEKSDKGAIIQENLEMIEEIEEIVRLPKKKLTIIVQENSEKIEEIVRLPRKRQFIQTLPAWSHQKTMNANLSKTFLPLLINLGSSRLFPEHQIEDITDDGSENTTMF